ncbi:MAG: exo-alpha-sialidase [Cyclobacteriaceae bacterium]|jgi:hypothetical protein|nr:exo-alpha-sialidase [Cyclobacteriaceae bacterium]
MKRHHIFGLVFLAACLQWLSCCSVDEAKLQIAALKPPKTHHAGEPYLFTDANKHVFLSWIESSDTLSQLTLSTLQEGHWSDPVVITSGTNWFVNWADYPLVTGEGNGNMLAHILDRSGPGKFSYDVKVTTTSNGVNWSTLQLLHDDGLEAEHGFVSMIPYGKDVFISWLDGRNTVGDDGAVHTGHDHHGEMTLRAAVVTYSGEKLQEWELDSRTCDCCQTTAAITANGPVVIYRDRSDDEVRDISIVRYVNNQWTAPQSIFNDNWTINGCPVNGPRCEVEGNTLGLAWFTMADNQAEVKVIFSSDGGASFGKPFRVSGEDCIGRVDLVMLNETTAMLSWMESGGIWVRSVSTDGVMSKPVKVADSSDARASGFPQLTRYENGVLMAWTDAATKTIQTAIIN